MSANVFTPEKIMESIYEFQRIRVILTGYELDVFTILGKKSLTSSDVASAAKTDLYAMDRLLNALVALGVLKKRNARFTNTNLSARYFNRGSNEFAVNLGHNINMLRNWNRLTKVVKRGRAIGIKQMKNRGKEWFEPFIAAMHKRAVVQAKEIVSKLNVKDANVLDIGGGSGAHAMEFIRRGAKQVTVFDLPDVIPLTKKYVTAAGMEKRISFIKGDFLNDDFGKDYDFIFISAIIHMLNPKRIRRLLTRAVKALVPGGRIAIQDFYMSNDRTSPVMGALFSINMLVGTKHGDTYTEQEVRLWMTKSKLYNIQRIDTSFEAPLLIGSKARGR